MILQESSGPLTSLATWPLRGDLREEQGAGVGGWPSSTGDREPARKGLTKQWGGDPGKEPEGGREGEQDLGGCRARRAAHKGSGGSGRTLESQSSSEEATDSLTRSMFCKENAQVKIQCQ